MASSTPKSKAARAPEKKTENKAARKPATAQRSQKPEATKPPAYMQAKLAVSHPQDSAEKEADHVARQVMRAAKVAPAVAPASAPKLQRASLEPAKTPEKNETLALKPVPAAANIQRRAQMADNKIQRDNDDNEESGDSGGADAMAGATVDSSLESRIEARRGSGSPLPATVAAEMSARFNYDFNSVRIHNDREAADLCAQTNARAFTFGNDIFFAPGEFAPETDSGRELLAHELTHVVQQGDAETQIHRTIDPEPSPPKKGTAESAAYDAISVLALPPIKHRHIALYTGAGARRQAGYSRNTSKKQTDIWKEGISIPESAIENKLKKIDASFQKPAKPSTPVKFNVGKRTVSSPWNELADRLIIPEWDRNGKELKARRDRFAVDHMIELQVFGDKTGDAGNVIGNMELLKGAENSSSGSAIMNSIRQKVIAWKKLSDPSFAKYGDKRQRKEATQWLKTHTITFTEIRRGEGKSDGVDPTEAGWWTAAEIKEAKPLDPIQKAPQKKLEGSAKEFVLASGPDGIEIARIPHTNLKCNLELDSTKGAVPGIVISKINLNDNAEKDQAGTNIGSLEGTWNLPNDFLKDQSISIGLTSIDAYCGSMGKLPKLNTDFKHLCPVDLPELTLRDGRIYGKGSIEPTLPLLRGHPIDVVMDGDDLRFSISYNTGMISIPLPGVAVDGCDLSLFYSTQSGLGGNGTIDFGVDRLGSGFIEAEISQRDGFSAAGSFQFDTELFDQADLRVWYRNDAFGGEGVLAITQPNKVRGIKSAQILASFGDSTFAAKGDVKPDIPGVQDASLRVDYSEKAGLTIVGTLQLAPNPAIRSGSVDVTVRKVGEDWKVAANGTAQPAIPGINSQLTVGYDDGAFTAEFSGAYARGMLSGNATVGTTNRSLGADGRPSGGAAPDAPLIIYGNGSATVQIAPWLQGTAGIRFAPNGEVTVSGEIGLPGQLEIFSRKEINKPLFAMSTQIPIFPGIVAEVGGNLSANASIGPGALDQMRIGIEYNPAHEENTHVTGDAHLNIPAAAGVRLGARAGIGLGITGASATGGLELGGTLGIGGAAEAGVHIDWMPSTGLAIDAEGYLHAEPKFKFDVSGYVAVTALGFSVYDNKWELAAYELGSNLRLGVRFPIHYREGQPFNVSLDDVKFEVPDVDPVAMVNELGQRIF